MTDAPGKGGSGVNDYFTFTGSGLGGGGVGQEEGREDPAVGGSGVNNYLTSPSRGGWGCDDPGKSVRC